MRASTAASQPNLGANHEGERRDEFLSVRTVSAQAQRVVADLDLRMSGSQIRRAVRGFIAEGRAITDLRTYLLGYADPTGETAVRNVMRRLS